jgi:hypothetical protein
MSLFIRANSSKLNKQNDIRARALIDGIVEGKKAKED